MTRFEKIRLAAFVLLSLLTGLAAWGVSRLHFADDYRSFFRSDDPAFVRLEQLTADFGSEENDLIVVLEGPDVLAPEALDLIRRIAAEAQQIDTVTAVYSVLSTPGLPRDADTLRTHILHHPLLAGRLVAPDASLTILVLRLGANSLRVEDIAPVVSQLRRLLDDALVGTTLQARITGLPALRLAIIRQLQRDMVVFNIVAVLAILLVGLLAFRRLSTLVIVGIPPALGALWTMGVLGWVGEPINVLTNVIPQLVLVIGFTDAVHILVHFQHQRREGLSVQAAGPGAARGAGKACALASLTTAIGFASLVAVPLSIIQRFGVACAVGVGLSFVAVIITVPLLASTRLGERVLLQGTARGALETTLLQRWLAPVMTRPRLVTGVGVLLTLVLIGSALQLRPDWWYRENLPVRHEAYEALAASDAALGGTLPVYALVTWDAEASTSLFEVLQEITDGFDALPNTHAPVSLIDLLRMLPGQSDNLAARMPLLSQIPRDLTQRWFRPDLRQALVTAQVADEGAAVLAPTFADLEASLKATEALHPGFRIHLTGLTVVASQASLAMIGALARSLGLAAVLIFGVIMLVFRSIRLGLVSLLPNVFPLAAAGALLVWTGQPLQYASVIIFSIALGLAVDDTIHLLSSFQRVRSQGYDLDTSMRQSVGMVGSAVVLTTVLLMIGFGTLLLGTLPGTRIFGALACVTLLMALLSDLALLPAMTLTAFGTRQTQDEERSEDEQTSEAPLYPSQVTTTISD